MTQKSSATASVSPCRGRTSAADYDRLPVKQSLMKSDGSNLLNLSSLCGQSDHAAAPDFAAWIGTLPSSSLISAHGTDVRRGEVTIKCLVWTGLAGPQAPQEAPGFQG
jgi:hypothetical protein